MLFRSDNPQASVILHHLGSGADAAEPVKLVTRLMQEIARLTGEEFKPQSDPEKLLEQLPQSLVLASAWAQRTKQELLIVLDGLDKVSDRKHLRWFPSALPTRVKLVASCLAGEILQAAKERLPWQELMVKPLTKVEQREFIHAYLGRYRKTLTAEHTRILQAHPLSGNPLFLLTVLEELRVFGVHEELEQRLLLLLWFVINACISNQLPTANAIQRRCCIKTFLGCVGHQDHFIDAQFAICDIDREARAVLRTAPEELTWEIVALKALESFELCEVQA